METQKSGHHHHRPVALVQHLHTKSTLHHTPTTRRYTKQQPSLCSASIQFSPTNVQPPPKRGNSKLQHKEPATTSSSLVRATYPGYRSRTETLPTPREDACGTPPQVHGCGKESRHIASTRNAIRAINNVRPVPSQYGRRLHPYVLDTEAM